MKRYQITYPSFRIAILLLLLGGIANGQVGIGVSSPDSSAILEIASDSLGFLPPRMTSAQRDAINKPAEGLMVYCTDCSETIYIYNGSSWNALNTSDNLGDHRATGNINLNGNYLSGDGGSEGVYVGNDGNVGLGNSSPSYDLDIIKATDSVEQRLYSSHVDGVGHLLVGANGGGHINLISNSQSSGDYKGIPIGYSGISADYKDMIFATGTGGNASEQMRLTTGGSLAIGTASPEGAFDVMTGTTNNDMNIHFEESGSDEQKIIFQEAGLDFFSIHHNGSDANPNNKLTFQSANGNDGTLDVDVMTFLQSGYVGIGTTSPTAHLTVYESDASVENFRAGRGATENIALDIQDINGYLTYNQDEDENNHDHHFFIRNNAQGTRDRTIQFQLNSDTELTVADEAIGTGTNDPQAPLHVHHASSGQTIDASKQHGLLIENSGSSTGWYALQTVTAAGVGLSVNNSGLVGIGVSVPGERLHVAGNIRMVDGNQSNGHILVSDANGTASWADPSTVNILYSDGQYNFGASASLPSLTSGWRNTSFGYQSTNALTTGQRNTAFGYNALADITTYGDNTAIGSEAMQDANSASSNTAIGSRSLQKIHGGDANVAVGYQSAQSIGEGSDNVILGYRAGQYVDAGNSNVFIGYSAGRNTTGSSNVFIGNKAGQDETGSDKLYIENSDGTTPLIGGDFGGNRVGINRTISNLSSGATFQVGGDASKSTSGSWSANSDRRLKTNIEYMDSGEILRQMLRMKGVTYNWNDTATGTPRPEGIQYGFIAQEIEKVWPSKITRDEQGYLMTAYGDYDAMFVESIRALHNRITQLETENAALKAKADEVETLKAEVAAIKEMITSGQTLTTSN